MQSGEKIVFFGKAVKKLLLLVTAVKCETGSAWPHLPVPGAWTSSWRESSGFGRHRCQWPMGRRCSEMRRNREALLVAVSEPSPGMSAELGSERNDHHLQEQTTD